jgi:hypothetical protein
MRVRKSIQYLIAMIDTSYDLNGLAHVFAYGRIDEPANAFLPSLWSRKQLYFFFHAQTLCT